MQIRTFLADDEPAARVRLRRLLDRHPQIRIIGEAANGIEAVEAIERLRPELLFLDIQMPGLSGFEVLKGLSKDTPAPLTIFVTGFHEHALEAFRARAIAYLLKPIEEDHLGEMIDRARRLLAPRRARKRRTTSTVCWGMSFLPWNRSWPGRQTGFFCWTLRRHWFSIWTVGSSGYEWRTIPTGSTINWES